MGNLTFVNSTRSPTSFPAVNTNTSTCILNKASGAIGDLMLAFIEAGVVNITAPSGWTLVSNYQIVTSNMTSNVYYKFDAGSEPSTYTWTDDSVSTTPLCGAMAAYRFVDTVNVVNAAAIGADPGATPSGTQSTPAVTTTAPTWEIHYVCGKTAQVTTEGVFTGGSGLTFRQRFSNRGGSTQYFAEIWDSNGPKVRGSQAGVSFTTTQTLTGFVQRQLALAITPLGGSAYPATVSVKRAMSF